MKLEEIGFYTLSDERYQKASGSSPLWRGELVLTGRCNFKCPYCRHVGGRDLDPLIALHTIHSWAREGLKNIRFSGGEPTLYTQLGDLVDVARKCGIERIALSTNGSASLAHYYCLLSLGVNDLSISLDACCAEDGDKMAGGIKGSWEKVCSNIKALSKVCYVTVGVVLTPQNVGTVNQTCRLAHDLGVADIRIIPAAQEGNSLQAQIDEDLLEAHPILKYRVERMREGKKVRGLGEGDPSRCHLVLDDVAAMGGKHYPCIIYMRESGKAIGEMGEGWREERVKWSKGHDCLQDPICRGNCIDVCVEYNRKFESCHPRS